MTNTTDYDILNKLSLETNECLTKGSGRTAEKLVEKRLKKFLTNVDEYDNLNKLFQTAKTKNLDN